MTDVVGTDERATTPPAAPPRWYPRVVERAADVALASMPVPLHVLDVGCGAGELLREMVARVPYGQSFVGVDPDPATVAAARRGGDPRMSFVLASPGSLPFEDASFDLVVAAAGPEGWPDPAAGVAELARVVRDGGRVVLLGRGRGLRRLLEPAGLRVERRETVLRRGFTLPYVSAFIAFP